MLQKIPLHKILFLDIETVPQFPNFSQLDEKTKQLYSQKTKFLQKDNTISSDELYERAGIYAEFGKIICISVGYIHEGNLGEQIRLKSFSNEDEEILLEAFVKLLEENPQFSILCGHNAKEFDFPYICRRLLIHGITLPTVLDIAGKKPWEINHLDTMELWKFGDYKAYTSLALLCHIFKIPTPKDDISGEDVARVYYEEKNLERIKVYCEKDVVALIQLLRKMMGKSLIKEDKIIFS
jgi:DNA polymerase elongation subunit (family B)